MKTFEDFNSADVIDLRSYEVTESEMIEFAKRYDPQTFHTDPKGAQESSFGGLIASGWLTGAIFMRMQCDSYMRHKRLRDMACRYRQDKRYLLVPTRSSAQRNTLDL